MIFKYKSKEVPAFIYSSTQKANCVNWIDKSIDRIRYLHSRNIVHLVRAGNDMLESLVFTSILML